MTAVEKLLSNELSGNYLSIKLPADLIARCDGLGSSAILLLLGYFELLSRQEIPSDVVELYILLDHMPPTDNSRWQRALAELLEEGLLLAHPQTAEDPQEPVLLFPATPEGTRNFEELQAGNSHPGGNPGCQSASGPGKAKYFYALRAEYWSADADGCRSIESGCRNLPRKLAA